ncbi:uncharacterized protein Dwil_GK27453 [Drosophila willistoni]|uniref:Uncharacterized protein n=1 Tax=Drosophila willistoni TaxID=7260 RepID=A0A0Q9X5W5_DROWI|nr:uncharacterized protein Dwil_GK27453 [Drosophila willistoni]
MLDEITEPNACLNSGEDFDETVEKLTRDIHEVACTCSPPSSSRHRPTPQKDMFAWSDEINNALLRNKATAAYLQELERNQPDHNIWQATKYLKRPTVRKVPILGWGLWCRFREDKAEEFVTHLANSFTPFSTYSAEYANATLSFLEGPHQMALPIDRVNPEEVKLEINRRKTTKSPGYDGIDAVTIECLPPRVIQLLSNIFNRIFDL